jgi:hypothetical protein
LQVAELLRLLVQELEVSSAFVLGITGFLGLLGLFSGAVPVGRALLPVVALVVLVAVVAALELEVILQRFVPVCRR